MRFVSWEEVVRRFNGKSVAVVGSAPSVLDNTPGFVDGHDVVVRVNNYRVGTNQGRRCDVHYSFYGSSIRKTGDDLRRDGVTLCMNKCPDGKPIECEWHEKHGKQNGIDFSYIYRGRKDFWFTDTYVPSDEQFRASFELLGGHIPTTGFAAILDVLACNPGSLYLTGFDGFASGVHNVNERWRPGDPTDPIGHRPEQEMAWIAANIGNYPIVVDRTLALMVQRHREAA